MTYQQTLDYLFTRLPMFSRIGAAAYKDNLDNTIRLCEELDNPQKKFRSVHIAGTNGKGSVSHMLAAICQTAGLKTGLHTSPHLKDFRERIKINGVMADEAFVVEFTERLKPVIEEIEPSFFEISVVMAFEYFSRHQVDIAIIETGLGGRLDSTNVVSPDLSVITNIGWDHMNLLGDTLEKIAGEKAGIIKQGTPVVIGETTDGTLKVFEKVAREKDTVLNLASQKRQALEWRWHKHQLIVEVATRRKTDHQTYQLDLPGIYQTRNLLTVLEACHQLQILKYPIEESHIHSGLQHVKKLTGLHGRWEVIHEHPTVVLDVAHNEAGIIQVMEQLEITDHHELHIVLGMVKDKEIERVLKLLPDSAKYYFTNAQIPRALPSTELHKMAQSFGLSGNTYNDVNAALKDAKSKARKDDLILVCGSVFLISEIEY